ncbi:MULTISPECIES: alpha/beta fold hydrolase [unclassified Beijerinckia]|uniref:alpha/beta fold hydrolase n=1 Tax=unclassified Beijerinckia TaxID=2638183 RepID=UPI00089662A8|nr:MULTISPECIES: alpha/beta fold hydrolase [unclassified Beijerinckia]MDH7796968.1 3-oxoadipate enol-lactonase [Beijerinckia sp. GAS462]SEC66964.1 3-oxoadipate enol-lactonase [Beijerinckia sp. 28-YEA-48]
MLNHLIERAAPEHGGDQAPWIIFSNSLMTDLSLWDEQVAVLRGRFNILRYDQRGHGASPVPGEAQTIPVLADDVIALLDRCKVATCTYVGLSMGVPTGLAAYRKAPARFERLILVDGQANSTAASKAAWDERITFARANGMMAMADQTVRRWLRPERVEQPLSERLHAMIAATPLEGFAACASALQNYDEVAVLAQIKVPTLLIVGREDGAMPATMHAMAAAIPGAKIQEIADAGHLPNYERPAAFNEILTSFLEVR